MTAEIPEPEKSSIDIQIEELTEAFLFADASFNELGTEDAYQLKAAAEQALNDAVVAKRRGRPGAQIVIEES